MALDFPNNPTLNQIYTAPSGVVWKWDGVKWVSGLTPAAAYATIPYVDAGDARAQNNVGRNLLHNPLFNIAQRGNGAFASSNIYTVDRWQTLWGGGGPNAVNRYAVADSTRAQIADEAAEWQLNYDFVGGAGANDLVALLHRIEDVRRLSGKTVTVSFFAASGSGTLKLGVGISQIFGTGGSPSPQVAVNGQAVTVNTIFTRYSLTFVMPSASGKTFGSTVGTDFTQLAFWYSSGATNAIAAGNVGVQSGTIALWGVQLEISSVMTPLEKPDPRYDLSNCQRFFMSGLTFAQGYGVTSSPIGIPLSIPYMRATPTLTATNVANTNLGGASIAGSSPILIYGSGQVVATGNWTMSISWTASADL